MIYLIEDDISVRRSLELFLESAGMPFKSFESGELFISAGMGTKNDLLLLDIHLPGMSGLELLSRITHENKCTPSIVITAFDDEQTRNNCRRYGVKAILRKPVDGEALMDLIKYHLHI